jgi:hypothetical protein
MGGYLQISWRWFNSIHHATCNANNNVQHCVNAITASTHCFVIFCLSLMKERNSDLGKDLLLRESEVFDMRTDSVEGQSGVETKWYRGEPMKYFVSITLGIIGGAVLNLLHASQGVITLSTVPGPLFLRALQCAVIPMM